jgi:hypothetical protein
MAMFVTLLMLFCTFFIDFFSIKEQFGGTEKSYRDFMFGYFRRQDAIQGKPVDPQWSFPQGLAEVN